MRDWLKLTVLFVDFVHSLCNTFLPSNYELLGSSSVLNLYPLIVSRPLRKCLHYLNTDERAAACPPYTRGSRRWIQTSFEPSVPEMSSPHVVSLHESTRPSPILLIKPGKLADACKCHYQVFTIDTVHFGNCSLWELFILGTVYFWKITNFGIFRFRIILTKSAYLLDAFRIIK